MRLAACSDLHHPAMMMNNTPEAPRARLHPLSAKTHLQPDDRFSFTPEKLAKPAPRLWERKPSTPVVARGSRKLWKRYQSAFDKMVRQKKNSTDDLVEEINDARYFDYFRAVKRLCLSLGEDERNGRERECSLLETKWELEISMKRRKIPAQRRFPSVESTHPDTESENSSTSDTPAVDCIAEANPQEAEPDLKGDSGIAQNEDAQESAASPNEDNKKTSTPAVVEELTAEQESTLVRSALRSSMDGEDTALLNDFLSKAQAKRAARAAMATPDSEEKPPVENVQTDSLRRVLDDLDANSQSPTKQPSPVVEVGPPALQQAKDETSPPSSPATRRSTRSRQAQGPMRGNVPVIRNTYLRRAKGTEFIFKERTEEQELELTTRSNTMHNKGGAKHPKIALKTLAKRLAEESSENSGPEPSESTPEKRGTKRVAWKKQGLVELEGEVLSDDSSDTGSDTVDQRPAKGSQKRKAGSSNTVEQPAKEAKKRKGETKSNTRTTRSTRSTKSKKDEEKKSAETPEATSTATPRKMRRVRQPESTTATSTDSQNVDPPASSSNSRKKITPKSPSSGLLAAPASKKVAATKSTDDSDGHTGSKSTGSKSKKILTTDAGATPKPKRVRSKT